MSKEAKIRFLKKHIEINKIMIEWLLKRKKELPKGDDSCDVALYDYGVELEAMERTLELIENEK